MILECITQQIDNIVPPTLSPLHPCSVPTLYLLHTLVSDWSRSFWLDMLLDILAGNSNLKSFCIRE